MYDAIIIIRVRCDDHHHHLRCDAIIIMMIFQCLPGRRRRRSSALTGFPPFADRPSKSTHKEQKNFSLWFDFSPFVFDGRREKVSLSSWAGLKWETALRGAGPELVIVSSPPVLHTPSPDDLEFITTPLRGGDEGQPTGRSSNLMHVSVSERESAEVIAWKEPAQQCRGPRPGLPPTTPTPARISPEKLSDIVTIVCTNPKQWKFVVLQQL